LATKNTKGKIFPLLFNETILLPIMNNLQVKRKHKHPLQEGKKTKKIHIPKPKNKKIKRAFPPLNPPKVYAKKKNTITRSPIELVGLCRFSPSYLLPSKQLTNCHLLKRRRLTSYLSF